MNRKQELFRHFCESLFVSCTLRLRALFAARRNFGANCNSTEKMKPANCALPDLSDGWGDVQQRSKRDGTPTLISGTPHLYGSVRAGWKVGLAETEPAGGD